MAEIVERRKSRVFLVDDHLLVRQNLTSLLQREADLEVCGEAEDAVTAFSLIRQHSPDLVILDISLKNSSGLHLLNNLKELQPVPLVLILSMHEETSYAERALRAGAKGYLTKEEASIDVLSAVRTVLAGRVHLSERMALRLEEKSKRRKSGNRSSAEKSSPENPSVV